MMFKRDQTSRLRAFADAAVAAKPDFVVQLGDFSSAAGPKPILAEWERFEGPRYHVIGNHDLDHADKEAVVKAWGMGKPYYSFDRGGFHFVALDKNNVLKPDGACTPYAKGNWYRAPKDQVNSFDPPQLEWLAADLAAGDKPTMIWMHESLVATDYPEVGNAMAFLDVVDRANLRARKATGKPRVVAVLFGHDHADVYGLRNDVHYVSVNSASYAYTGGAYFYTDPLFSFMTLDPAGRITLEGRTSDYVAGVPEKVRAQVPPRISSRTLTFG